MINKNRRRYNMMMNGNISYFILAFLLCIPLVSLSIVDIVKDIHFEQRCGGFLERASNANTIPIALGEIERSLLYIENNNLTKGYTSLFFQTPDEDIEFWYNNLLESKNELIKANEDTGMSQLEQSNVLMKLRESLISRKRGSAGDKIIIPEGIHKYPNNKVYLVGYISFGILSVVGIIIFGMVFHNTNEIFKHVSHVSKE